MKQLKHDLLTAKYTSVCHESPEDMKFNAPHMFVVEPSYGYVKSIGKQHEPISPLCQIHFQEGPIKECGVNGVCNEDLIAMVITRLEHFQKSEFSCRDNEVAITKLEEAMLWLRKRTMARENRGGRGDTYQVVRLKQDNSCL